MAVAVKAIQSHAIASPLLSVIARAANDADEQHRHSACRSLAALLWRAMTAKVRSVLSGKDTDTDECGPCIGRSREWVVF
jgi:hypothetical protein